MSEQGGYFITATGTGAGKTVVTLGLIALLRQQGHTVAAMKPVAAGCEMTPVGLRHDDALQLQQAASVQLPYTDVNPYALGPPIAPHIGAEAAGVVIDVDIIVNKFNEINAKTDCVLIEGVGGWLVPLNAQQTLADLASALELPVILVVGLQLGCLNHALLTAASIRARGCQMAGWVANRIPGDMAAVEATIESLTQRLECPLLGCVPTLAALSAKKVANYLTLGPCANT